MTARAALTTIEIIEDEGLVENAAARRQARAGTLQEHEAPPPRDRRCARARPASSASSSSAPGGEAAGCRSAEAVLYRALDRGLSFKTTMGNVLTLTPPLTVSEAEMISALDILEEAIAAG